MANMILQIIEDKLAIDTDYQDANETYTEAAVKELTRIMDTEKPENNNDFTQAYEALFNKWAIDNGKGKLIIGDMKQNKGGRSRMNVLTTLVRDASTKMEKAGIIPENHYFGFSKDGDNGRKVELKAKKEKKEKEETDNTEESTGNVSNSDWMQFAQEFENDPKGLIDELLTRAGLMAGIEFNMTDEAA